MMIQICMRTNQGVKQISIRLSWQHQNDNQKLHWLNTTMTMSMQLVRYLMFILLSNFTILITGKQHRWQRVFLRNSSWPTMNLKEMERSKIQGERFELRRKALMLEDPQSDPSVDRTRTSLRIFVSPQLSSEEISQQTSRIQRGSICSTQIPKERSGRS